MAEKLFAEKKADFLGSAQKRTHLSAECSFTVEQTDDR
jgi:hypothetical protein